MDLSTRARLLAKRAIDLGGALIGITATLPLQAGLAGLVRLTMGTPVLFRQERPGLGGRPFSLLKFRTMRHPRDEIIDQRTDDARLTPIGRFMRSFSLDELPTLFNVLKGDMSLVGPRPLLMQYLPRYSAEQRRRHEVKPGITGLAQVRGRNAISWDEKLALDVRYVDRQTFCLDLRILAETVATVLLRHGATPATGVTMPEFMGSKCSDA
jgi:lipopolysaccharide/colanic/teichoic acid biosynthesis glycosyltransferase